MNWTIFFLLLLGIGVLGNAYARYLDVQEEKALRLFLATQSKKKNWHKANKRKKKLQHLSKQAA